MYIIVDHGGRATPSNTVCFQWFSIFSTSFTKNHDPANLLLCCWALGSLFFPGLNHWKHTGKLTFPAGRGHRCTGSAYTTLQILMNIDIFLWKSPTVNRFLPFLFKKSKKLTNLAPRICTSGVRIPTGKLTHRLSHLVTESDAFQT